MLFDTTLRRELARTFSATLVVILTIVLTTMLMRAVKLAATGSVAPQDIVLFMGFTALGSMATILALALFVSVVVTLGRMYRDSEMAVWFASGIPLTRFVRPVLRMAWPVLLIIVVTALVLWPWSNEQNRDLQDRYQQRSDVSRVSPGVFQSNRDGSGVLFVERTVEAASGQGQARNVFVVQQRDQREAVVSARVGRLDVRSDDQWLVLDDGQRTEVDAATGQRSLASFERFESVISEGAARRAQQTAPKTRTTLDLLAQPTAAHQGELAWRLGLSLGAFNLMLLGIGLAARNPRNPSSWSVLFALLAFIVYYNLITLTQAWVAGGRVGMVTALVVIHGSVLAMAVALLYWRDHAAVLRWWPTRATKVSA
jgi:lipopolysaccharide export system permease protein